MRIAVHPPATVSCSESFLRHGLWDWRGFLATSALTFLPKAANSGWGVTMRARAHTHTHALAVSQGMPVEDMAFRNTLGSTSRCGRSRWRSALGEQKIFGV